MRPNPKFSADLATFTKEILNGVLHFQCSEGNMKGTICWVEATKKKLNSQPNREVIFSPTDLETFPSK